MRVVWTAAIVLLVDQAAKITVVNTMYRGQSIEVLGNWLRLTYTENPGMAFGIELGHPVIVTILSISATALILYYMFQIGASRYAPYRYSLALVLGGAIGNIVDRIFYGLILYDEPLFLGRVVDFIHVNLWRGLLPEALPVVGGHYVAFFPIWNVADMAIVSGVVGIILFQNRFHASLKADAEAAASAVSDAGDTVVVVDSESSLDRERDDAG